MHTSCCVSWPTQPLAFLSLPCSGIYFPAMAQQIVKTLGLALVSEMKWMCRSFLSWDGWHGTNVHGSAYNSSPQCLAVLC